MNEIQWSTRGMKAKLNDIIKLISGLIVLIGIAFTVFFFMDNRHASSTSFNRLAVAVSTNKLENTLHKALENLYFYRDQLRKYPNDDKIKKKLEEAEDEVKNIKDRIKKLKEKVDSGN